jgi:hypothetical protein
MASRPTVPPIDATDIASAKTQKNEVLGFAADNDAAHLWVKLAFSGKRTATVLLEPVQAYNLFHHLRAVLGNSDATPGNFQMPPLRKSSGIFPQGDADGQP